ncbi:Gfo/Idh/MocA family oxidoreductase, partial [uncultured Porphyromonas sp.]|uniref:Gfo/Idh/MocA family oxidoreductase n=1 Tax=uncultured Porphyromonas sp. TaxID=159274 RepID=UPI0026189898
MTANHSDLTTFALKPLHSPLRWIVVGCGHIGRRHMEHISKHPQTQLVGMVDVLPAAECGAAQFAEIPFYQSVEELLERGGETFDVASICV